MKELNFKNLISCLPAFLYSLNVNPVNPVKKIIPEDILEIKQQDPVILPPWDPMI